MKACSIIQQYVTGERAQEYCNGGALREMLVAGHFAQDHMRSHWRSVMLVMQGTAAGMQYVHGKRICHGDLNPSNILLKVRRVPAIPVRLHSVGTCALHKDCRVCRMHEAHAYAIAEEL